MTWLKRISIFCGACGVGAGVLGVVGAGLDIIAANVEIRNSVDQFISDLDRQGTWATSAAICTAIAAPFAAIAALLQAFGDR